MLELSKTDDEFMMEVSNPKQKLNTVGVIGGKKLYKGYIYGVYQYLFELEEMPGDGDCGFHALEITRTQLFDFLASKVDDERIRLSLLFEIREEMAVNPTNEFLRFYQDDVYIDELWRIFLLDVRKKYHLPENFRTLGEYEGQLEEFFVDKDDNLTLQKGLDLQKQKKENQQKIDNYLTTKDVYVKFIRNYIRKGYKMYLGIHSADEYCKFHNIQLYIWTKDLANTENVNIKSVYGVEEFQAIKIVHLLYTSTIAGRGLNHYDRLKFIK